MSRYGQAFKDRVVARLVPPESADINKLSRDIGVDVNGMQAGPALTSEDREHLWDSQSIAEAWLSWAGQ
jgi:transposase